jgi:endonuclease YncB( thermonuclease family)
MKPLTVGGFVFAALLGALGVRELDGAWARGSAGRPAVPRTCTLVRVLDGDSLALRCGGKALEVRLHCIDAPEWTQGTWGKSAMRSLRVLTPPRVEIETVETDRFGRPVVNLYGAGPDRPFINLRQVELGQAAVYQQFCDDPRFKRAEEEARRAGRGIWLRPGAQQRPWEYRHRDGG